MAANTSAGRRRGPLTLLVVVIAVASHLHGESSVNDPNQPDPAWWTVLIVLVGTIPIYWRRINPLVAGLVVVTAEVTALFIGLAGAAFIGSVIAVYSIGAYTVGVFRTRVMTAIAALVIGLFIAGWIDGLQLLDEFISTGVLLITVFVVGDNLRRRRQHVADLAERAERAECEQGLLAEQRVTAERTRIARDLHDVVAHSVSVMVIQAAAARRNLTTDPDAASETLASIESTGRQTMSELRAILGVLRTETADAALDPQPSLHLIDALVAADDLPVAVSVEGEVAGPPDSVSVTGYRLVQEALTNVRRHAGPVSRRGHRPRPRRCRTTRHRSQRQRSGSRRQASADGFGIVGMRATCRSPRRHDRGRASARRGVARSFGSCPSIPGRYTG